MIQEIPDPGPKASTPALNLISDYVAFGAKQFPDRDFAVLGDHALSYAEAHDRVDEIARALLAAGVRKGSRVATLLPPCPEFFLVFLATASIGAIWVGLNPKYSVRELAHPIVDCEPSLVLARLNIDGRDYSKELKAICTREGETIPLVAVGNSSDAGFTEWQSFLSQGASVCREELITRRSMVLPDDPCLIVYTSGTTGKPKGAMLKHAGLVYCSRTDARYNLVNDVQRMLCNFPINHIACVGDVCSTTLVVGGTIIFMEEFDPEGVLRTIESQRVTHLGQIPVMLQAIFSCPLVSKTDLSSLQYIIWGGNPASVDLVRRVGEYVPNLCNVYGMTETTGNVLFVRGDHDNSTYATTVGWAPEEYEVTLLDDAGAPTVAGETGEICVRGDHLMLGYWNNAKASKAAFHDDGWMRTGDLAFQRHDGAYCIAGRRSEMYKSGGYNIYPAEIEQALEGIEGVEMAVVVGVPDPVYSEVGHAFLLTEHSGLDLDGVKRESREVLANYKIPKQFHVVKTFPLLPNGKVDKKALKALAVA